MYLAGLIQSWGVLHLQSGGWYIDCDGGFCPAEEETMKKNIDQEEKRLGSSDLPTTTTDLATPDQDATADLSHMNEKEKAKALRQMKRAAKKAKARRVIEEQKKAEKVAKADLVANMKAMAAEVVATIKATGKAPAALQSIGGPGLDDTQISSTSPSRVLQKRDS